MAMEMKKNGMGPQNMGANQGMNIGGGMGGMGMGGLGNLGMGGFGGMGNMGGFGGFGGMNPFMNSGGFNNPFLSGMLSQQNNNPTSSNNNITSSNQT